jgi:hypothetical protein
MKPAIGLLMKYQKKERQKEGRKRGSVSKLVAAHAHR